MSEKERDGPSDPWIPILYDLEKIKKVLEMPAGEFIDSLPLNETLSSTVTAAIDIGANGSIQKFTEMMKAAFERRMTIDQALMRALVLELNETIEKNKDSEGKISPCILEDIKKKANSVVRGRVQFNRNEREWMISREGFEWVLKM